MNCKAGQKAIVIGSRSVLTRDNIGAIVMCVELAPTEKDFWIEDRCYVIPAGVEAWIVEAVSRPLMSAHEIFDVVVTSNIAVISDERLKPVSGLDDGNASEEDRLPLIVRDCVTA